MGNVLPVLQFARVHRLKHFIFCKAKFLLISKILQLGEANMPGEAQ